MYYELSNKLKKEAFHKLDHGRSKMVRVNANELIDLCLKYEDASKGDFSNLEYSNKVLLEDKQKLMSCLAEIADLAEEGSEIYNIAMNHGGVF